MDTAGNHGSGHALRRRPARLVAALALAMGLHTAPAGAQQTPTLAVPFYSQFDPIWSKYGVGYNRDVPMGRMGSLLTCVSMVASYHDLLPRFDTPGSAQHGGAPTPDYIHAALYESGGYQLSPPKTVIIDYQGLARGFLTALGRPAGLTFMPRGWPSGRARVDDELAHGRPTILYAEPSPNRFHPFVVVGRDDDGTYMVLDPARLRWDGAAVPISRIYGSNWQSVVSGMLEPFVWTADDPPMEIPPLDEDEPIELAPLTTSTKSPVEITVVDPHGRRVGWDAATGTTVIDVPGASYLPQPVWADPTGTEAPRPPGRLLTIPNAIDGRYRFEMIATGDGPYTLNVKAYDLGRDRVVEESRAGTVHTGDVLKFQVEYSRTGQSHFTIGDDFAPEANAGGTKRTTVGAVVPFDGRASYDVDGSITSYVWTFGDGATASGATAGHAYALPGTYVATLSVTDDAGATTVDTAEVAVYGDEPAAGATERISVGDGGGEAYGFFGSFAPAMSADGRVVAFTSWATNVGRDGGAVVLRDRLTGTSAVISPSTCLAADFADVSADGRFIAFECVVMNVAAGTGERTIVVHDAVTGADERVDVSDAGTSGHCDGAGCGSIRPAISGDGRFVAFYSTRSDLVAGDGNGAADAFVRDRHSDTTERVDVTSGGAESSAGAGTSDSQERLGISGDGRFVVFSSLSSDLVPGTPPFFVDRVYVRDRQMHTTELASVAGQGPSFTVVDGEFPSISADGRRIAFASYASTLVPGDTNGMPDVFVRDRVAGTTERVNVSGAGGQTVCGPFRTPAECTRNPVISRDGGVVAFRSHADDLILADTNDREDVFVRDRAEGVTEVASLSTEGQLGDGNSGEAHFTNDPTQIALSGDGRFVAFSSDATNLVTPDDNEIEDVFVRDRQPPRAIADPSGPYLGWADTPERPASVRFDASGSLHVEAGALVAHWDFGDGSPIVDADSATLVSHAYAAPGRYVVTLVVSSGEDVSAPATTIARILPSRGPSLTATPACGSAGERITLSAEGRPLVARDGGWNLARGPVPDVRAVHPGDTLPLQIDGPIGAQHAVPIDAYSTASPLELALRADVTVGGDWIPGTYVISVPGDGGAATVVVPCPTPANAPPRADVGGPYAGVVGEPVQLDGRASSDPEGRPLTFRWYVDEEEDPVGGERPERIFSAPGTYLLMLVVNDGELDSPTSALTGSYTTITITDAPPPPVTTTTTVPPTSTTLPADACGRMPREATFDSLACRLAALRGQTVSALSTSDVQRWLVARLDKAGGKLDVARTQCAAGGRPKRPKAGLGRTARLIATFAHRLRSHAARKSGYGAAGAPLALDADGIRADAMALRRRLQCPVDASR
jgi:PKD repeat protein